MGLELCCVCGFCCFCQRWHLQCSSIGLNMVAKKAMASESNCVYCGRPPILGSVLPNGFEDTCYKCPFLCKATQLVCACSVFVEASLRKASLQRLNKNQTQQFSRFFSASGCTAAARTYAASSRDVCYSANDAATSPSADDAATTAFCTSGGSAADKLASPSWAI